MSKVLRLSDTEIKMLEEFRKFKLSQYNKMVGEFPHINQDIEKLEKANIEELLFSAISSSCYWEEQNDNNMK